MQAWVEMKAVVAIYWHTDGLVAIFIPGSRFDGLFYLLHAQHNVKICWARWLKSQNKCMQSVLYRFGSLQSVDAWWHSRYSADRAPVHFTTDEYYLYSLSDKKQIQPFRIWMPGSFLGERQATILKLCRCDFGDRLKKTSRTKRHALHAFCCLFPDVPTYCLTCKTLLAAMQNVEKPSCQGFCPKLEKKRSGATWYIIEGKTQPWRHYCKK